MILREYKLVDHAVVVDAKNNVFIDSEDSTAMVISVRIIDRCSGQGSKNLRVFEVRIEKHLKK